MSKAAASWGRLREYWMQEPLTTGREDIVKRLREARHRRPARLKPNAVRQETAFQLLKEKWDA